MCISLTRRFEDQIEASKLPVEAIPNKLINIATDKRISPFTRRNIRTKSRRSHDELDGPESISRALSHRQAWKQLLDSGAGHALILEGSTVLPAGIIDRLNVALNADPLLIAGKWELLILSKVKSSAAGGFQPVKHFESVNAYLLSRRAAKILYDEALPLSHQVNSYIGIQANQHNLLTVASSDFELPQLDSEPVQHCAICDIPTDFNENYLMVPHSSWKLAKGSEYVILIGLLSYLAYRAFK